MTARVALITGGAGGIGRALAALLVARGWRVAALDRDAEALARLPDGVRGEPCDLTDLDAAQALCARIAAEEGRIDMVVHAAGVTQLDAFADTPLPVIRRVMEINFLAAAAVCAATLHPLRETRGRHVAVSSVAGFAPLIRRAGYAASKHALEGFFASLREEERPHGVGVTIVAPSFVATNRGADRDAEDGTRRPGQAEDGVDYMDPEEAARRILAAIDGGVEFAPIGRVARLSWLVRRLSPALYARLMRRRIGG